MVEDNPQEILDIIYFYTDEIKKCVIRGGLADFRNYIHFYDPITKDLIHAFIYFNYVIGMSGIFGSAEIADATLEGVEALNLDDAISFIETIYNLCSLAGRKFYIPYDATRIFVCLLVGTMTVKDVVQEEKGRISSKEFIALIRKYLNYLEEGICFEDLYSFLLYDYTIFINKRESALTNITSYDDGSSKCKALHCANHIFSKKRNTSF